MKMIRLYLIFIILSIIIVSGCIYTDWCTPPPYKKPPDLTIDTNVTKMINYEWNKTYGNTSVMVDNSSIQFHGYSADDYEAFIFNTTDGKMYTCTMSIKGSLTPNMLDINDHPVEAYNLTIAPYQLLPTFNGPQPVVTPAPPYTPKS